MTNEQDHKQPGNINKPKQYESFLIEEYKALRSELEIGFQAIHKIEYEVVLATIAIFSFLFAAEGFKMEVFNTILTPIVGMLPIFLGIIGWFRNLSTKQSILRIARYIRKTEDYFLSAPGIPKGWEHDMEEFRANTNPLEAKFAFGRYQIIFWSCLIFVNLVVAITLWALYLL